MTFFPLDVFFKCIWNCFFCLFVFICLTLEFIIYFCGTSKLAYLFGLKKLVKVSSYIPTFTNLLNRTYFYQITDLKTFVLIFSRLKNKTALIPSFILLLVYSYPEFCPCFAHSLNLVGSCAVEANAAACNFDLMIQQLYRYFSSSTYLWEKLEDMLKNTATNHKLLVVKRLSNVCKVKRSSRLVLGYNEYIDFLKSITADEWNYSEVQNDAKGLVKRLSQLETCIFLTVWNTLLERFQQTSSALQKRDQFKHNCLSPGIVASVRWRSLWEIQNFRRSGLRKKWKANLR